MKLSVEGSWTKARNARAGWKADSEWLSDRTLSFRGVLIANAMLVEALASVRAFSDDRGLLVIQLDG